MRKHGLACDNLRSVEIVTADGQLRTADATEHPDLFWGVRGGGGNFGIVTSFDYGSTLWDRLLAASCSSQLEQARDALRFYRELMATAPDELMAYALFLTSPDGAPLCAVAGVLRRTAGGRRGDPASAEEPGRLAADSVRPMSYLEIQSMFDAGLPLWPLELLEVQCSSGVQ